MYIQDSMVYEVDDIIATSFNILKLKTYVQRSHKFTTLLIYRFHRVPRQIFVNKLDTKVSVLNEPIMLRGDINLDIHTTT